MQENLENSAVVTGVEKGQSSLQPQRKTVSKKCFNCCTIAPISHPSEVMLKVLQARLQQYVNCELPDVQARLEKSEKPEVKLSTSVGS